MLDGANRIQDQTLDSLSRTRGMIEASKEVGAATIEGILLHCEKNYFIVEYLIN